MAGYEKVTLDAFKSRLENGDYASLAGARRGIGKMAGWSEKDREKARALAEKHFGADGAKAAPKKAAKRGKKAKVKAAPAVRAPKKAAKKGGRRPRAESPAEAGAASSAHADALSLADREIKTVRDALDAAALAQHLGADPASVSAMAKNAQAALGTVVDRLGKLTMAYTSTQIPAQADKAATAFEKASVAAAQTEGPNGLQGAPVPAPAQPEMSEQA
jgi:hypothetical protein